jgi:Tfp pilus assembly protein PilE
MIQAFRRVISKRADGQNDEGFALVERHIVIAGLGTLAAVAIFAVGAIVGQSAQAACAADGATVSTAIAAFDTQNPTTTPTDDLIDSTSTVTGGPFTQSWPSNLPHYAFQIDAAGNLQYSDGVIYSTGTYSTTSETGNVSGADEGLAISPWYNYVGPVSCTDVG